MSRPRTIPGRWSRAVLAEALAMADGLVQARHRPLTVAHTTREGGRFIFRWEYPGILRVFCGTTGELLARSKPGTPSELADDGEALPGGTDAA